MPMIARTMSVPINPGRLLEELQVNLPADVVDLRGYIEETPRKHVLRKAPFVYEKTLTGQREAQPGDVHVGVTRNLTAQEVLDLDGTLSAHVHTVLSAVQVREDSDKVDLADIRATLNANQTVTQDQIRKFMRIMLREI